MSDVIDDLKRQASKNAAGQANLERLVLKANQEGRSLREIAKAAKLTPEGVRKMIARLTAGEPTTETT